MATRPRTFAGTIQGARRTGLNQPVRAGGIGGNRAATRATPRITAPAGLRARAAGISARAQQRTTRGVIRRGTGGGG